VVGSVVARNLPGFAERQLRICHDGSRTAVRLVDGGLIWLETAHHVAFRLDPTKQSSIQVVRQDSDPVLPLDAGAEAVAMLSVEEACDWIGMEGAVPGPSGGTYVVLGDSGSTWNVAADPLTGLVHSLVEEPYGARTGGLVRAEWVWVADVDETWFALPLE
jgi:hypothetical protein